MSTPGEATARAARSVVTGLGGAFMISPEAKAAGKDGGFRGRELYVVGRAGVLGDAVPEVVASAIGFFEPALVTSAWAAGRAKAPVADTVRRYAEVCQAWGRNRWSALAAVDELADLLGTVADAADPTGWTLFAGWRAQPLPADAPARAAHLLQVLREHRGGAHLAAVRVAGLTPLEAIVAGPGGPGNAAFFGWPDPLPGADDALRERHARAEALTDQLVAPAYAVLDDHEGADLARLLAAARDAAYPPEQG